MNIIYLVSDLRSAGPTNQAFNLMTGLQKCNVNKHLVTLFDEPEDSWFDRFVCSGVTIYQLHSNRKQLKNASRQLDRYIQENNVQIVHSSGFSADIVNRLLKSPVKKLTTIRQNKEDLGEKRNVIIKLLLQWMTQINYKAMDRIVACSRDLSMSIKRDFGLPCNYVENGVDIDRFRPLNSNQKKQLRGQLGLPQDKVIYVCVGVFYMRKQMLEMARAFISQVEKNSLLLIVGDGETFEQTRQIVAEAGNVIMVGKKNDPLPYFQASDIFVSASLAEGLPNSVMEAMSCGLPCILSDIGPHKEILEFEPEAGVLYKVKDYDDLKQKFYDSLSWNLSEKSLKALQLVNKNLSKYVTAQNYYTLYKTL